MVISEVRTATKFLKLRPTSNSCTSSSQFLAAAVSIFLLVFFSTVITTNLLVGSPIECTKPPESELTQEFIHAYCWNENMFTIPPETTHYMDAFPYPGVGPRTIFGKREPIRVHVYYQWVPLILAIQAFFIAGPQFLWKYLENNHIKSMVTVLNNPSLIFEDLKCRCETVGRYFLNSRKSRRAMHYFYWFWLCSFSQVLTFILIWWTTDIFLDGKFSWLGPEILEHWRFGNVESIYTTFPRLAKCNLEHYGSSGSLQTTDFLCFLSASLWHSRVFFILWWWYIIAIILSCVGLFTSTLFIIKKTRIYFITTSLLSQEEHQKCMNHIDTFFSIHDCLLLYLLRRSLDPLSYSQLLHVVLQQGNFATNVGSLTTTKGTTTQSANFHMV